jgi:hypothetical protein
MPQQQVQGVPNALSATLGNIGPYQNIVGQPANNISGQR